MTAPCSKLIFAIAAFATLAPAQAAAFHLYSGREVIGSTGPFRTDRAPLDVLLGSPIGKKYASLKPERSILLSDCLKNSPYCESQDFSFSKILSLAATGLSLPQGDVLAYCWYLSARKDNYFKLKVDPWVGKPLDKAPFHLLAIANRMDLASWTGNRWEDAELRFVFGAKPQDETLSSPLELTVIVEFILPSFDWPKFREFAGFWENLGDLKGPSFLYALGDVLKASGLARPRKVRIRTNVGNAGPWRLTEWDLTRKASVKAGQPLDEAPLEEQIADKFINAPVDSQDYKDYLTLWPDITSVPGPKHVAIPARFWEPGSLTYRTLDEVLPTPERFCATDATRRALALQRCTGCHLKETIRKDDPPPFTQISNRMPGQSSRLAGFLAGGAPNVSLEDIYFGTHDKVFEVTFPYRTYKKSTTAVCDQLYHQTITRRFHDISRRRLFLAAVLVSDPYFTVGARKLIEEYRTNYSH